MTGDPTFPTTGKDGTTARRRMARVGVAQARFSPILHGTCVHGCIHEVVSMMLYP